MAKINKAEVIGVVLGTAGLGMIAVGMPFTYYGEKFSNEHYGKAHQPRGIIYKIGAAELNIETTRYKYLRCVEELLPEEKCSVLNRVYLSAWNTRNLLDEELKKYYSTLDKFRAWREISQNGILGGIFLAAIGLIIFSCGVDYRKWEERQEAEARKNEGLQPCSSIDEKLYCEDNSEPHL